MHCEWCVTSTRMQGPAWGPTWDAVNALRGVCNKYTDAGTSLGSNLRCSECTASGVCDDLKISYRFLGLNRALQGALNVHSMCTPCALHVHSMCTPCALHVHSMCTPCALHVHSMWEREREWGIYICFSQYAFSVSWPHNLSSGRQGFVGLNISLLGERETGF